MGIEGNTLENQPFDPTPAPPDKSEVPDKVESEIAPNIGVPELSLSKNDQIDVDQTEPPENREDYVIPFERAAKLGRDWIGESRQREDRGLVPYLNQRKFNPEHTKSLRNRDQLAPADVEGAKSASMVISLQAADQIVLAKFPRQGPERALKQRTIEDEIDSLGKIDRMLGAGFHQAQAMIKEDRANQLIQQARQVIAYRQKISPDQIETSDQQVLEWVQNTMQEAGKRVRQHRDKAKQLWSQARGGGQFRDPLYPSQ